MYFTMKIIRHKTKRKKFMLGIPLIVLAQILLAAAWFICLLYTSDAADEL